MRKYRNRFGKVLHQSLDPQSSGMLALLYREYYKLEQGDWEKWLAFRAEYFKELGDKGKVCHYCRRDDLDWTLKPGDERLATLDHIFPVAKGGAVYDKSNLVVACEPCNFKKDDKMPEGFKN